MSVANYVKLLVDHSWQIFAAVAVTGWLNIIMKEKKIMIQKSLNPLLAQKELSKNIRNLKVRWKLTI